MLECVSYQRRGAGDVSLRQPDERETRLRIPSRSVRGQQRLLGTVEVSLQ